MHISKALNKHAKTNGLKPNEETPGYILGTMQKFFDRLFVFVECLYSELFYF